MSFISLQFERRLPGVTLRDANLALVQAIKAAGFQLTTQQLGMVEGKRGSQITSMAMQSKLPIRVSARLVQVEGACDVYLEAHDDSKVPASKLMGMSAAFTRALNEVQQQMDTALQHLAPGVAFPEPRLYSSAANLGALDTANAATVSAGDKVVAKANQLLGGRQAEIAPQAWKGLAGVFLQAPAGTAALEMLEVHALLSAGALVSLRPGSMPPNLVAEVEALVMRLESELAGHETKTLAIAISKEEQPVVEFLREQARIRSSLPMRNMMVCQTCRFEKIVNPDYQRLVKRNSRLKTLLGTVGASWGGSGGGLRMFVAVGKMIGSAGLDPDFVCPRCQGTTHDDYLITYCPKCGDRRTDSVLRQCPKCKHDFRKDVPPEHMWHSETSLVLPVGLAKVAAPVPATAAPASVPASAMPAATDQPVTAVVATTPPPVPESAAPTPAPNWYTDPLGQHQYRYWDGVAWTSHVADNGQDGEAPL